MHPPLASLRSLAPLTLCEGGRATHPPRSPSPGPPLNLPLAEGGNGAEGEGMSLASRFLWIPAFAGMTLTEEGFVRTRRYVVGV